MVWWFGGLWHGAARTYVFWGLLHGGYLVANQIWRDKAPRKLPPWFAQALTLFAVIVAWVFFRADTFTSAGHMLAAMASVPQMASLATHAVLAVMVATGMAIALFTRNTWEVEFRATALRAGMLAALFILCVLRMSEPSPFLYFQF